jgi:alpha-beta hydrolase superfamily lysophospholipase
VNHVSAFFPDSKGARIHYQAWEESAKGYDRIALVLHGLGCHSGSYPGLLAAFVKARYKVIAPDFAGFGQSPGERGAGGVVAMADMIEALCRRIEAVEGSREIEIVAHSMGAVAALLFLKRYPARRNRAALVSPLFYGLPVEATPEALAIDEDRRRKLAEDPLYAAAIPAELAADLDKSAKELLADPSFLEGRKAAFFVGEDDPIVSFEALKKTVAALPLKDARFASFPRSRHEMLGDKGGDKAISAILSWLDETRFEYRT